MRIQKFNAKSFDKKTKIFNTRKELYFFLMNVLNLITYNGHYYCFCDEEKKKTSNERDCPLCQIPFIFCDFEKDLGNNMFTTTS